MLKRISNFLQGGLSDEEIILLQLSTLTSFFVNVSRQFRRNSLISRTDFAAVELLLRTGHRQLETYSSPGVKNIAS